MTIHQFTPPGRISDAEIDALIEQYEPDEWLPAALKVPFLVGNFFSALMAIALGLLIFVPQFLQVALTITFLWPIALAFTVISMNKLARWRREENRRRQSANY